MKQLLLKLFNWWIIKKADREDRYYRKVATESYDLDLIKKKLAGRHYARYQGELKILKVYQHHNWEDLNLLPALRRFGRVVEYPMDFNPYSIVWQLFRKRGFNKKFSDDVRRAIKSGEINLIFFYASGLIFQARTIREISVLGIPMVNLALDDYLKFKAYPTLTGWSGNVAISKYMTLTITSYREACNKYLAEKAIPLYLPEGGNAEKFTPVGVPKKDIDVCFIGKNYGVREELVEFLKSNGIKIEVYGKGWPSGQVSHQEMLELYSRSKIALGISDSWGSGRFDIPGRDFEVPLMGPMYLTEYNGKIGDFYRVGEEIVLYRGRDELLEKIKYYLTHEDERTEIAKKGRERALKEHTWEKRFEYVFKFMSILK